jgi:hypothetical protein
MLSSTLNCLKVVGTPYHQPTLAHLHQETCCQSLPAAGVLTIHSDLLPMLLECLQATPTSSQCCRIACNPSPRTVGTLAGIPHILPHLWESFHLHPIMPIYHFDDPALSHIPDLCHMRCGFYATHPIATHFVVILCLPFLYGILAPVVSL